MTKSDDLGQQWEGDHLDRKKQSKFIKSFLDQQYEFQRKNLEPCTYTINIDARWGFGKSFFLEKWRSDLQSEGYWVVYYNAWANDYTMDPLSSLIVEVSEQLEKLISTNTLKSKRWKTYKESLRTFLNSWSIRDYIRFGTTAASAAVACPIFIPDSLLDQTESQAKQVVEGIRSALSGLPHPEEYDALSRERDRRDSLKSFQASLKSFTGHLETLSQKLPLFIFVDELDRCKPDFTIGLIECVKHILAIDHIYFVFATDGDQLQNAINGAYGGKFDAELYFKRVFDRDITLTQPDNEKYVNALCDRFGYNLNYDFSFNEGFLLPDEEFVANTAKCFYAVSKLFRLSLRDQEQAFSVLDSIIKARANQGKKTNVAFSSFIVVLWLKRKSVFYKLRDTPQRFTVEDVKGIKGFDSESEVQIGYLDTKNYRQARHNILVWDLANFHVKMLSKSGDEFRKSLLSEWQGSNLVFSKFILEEYDSPDVMSYSVNPMLKYFDEVAMIG